MLWWVPNAVCDHHGGGSSDPGAERHADLRRLVSGYADGCAAEGQAGDGDAAGYSAGAGKTYGWARVCDARFVPAPGDPAERGVVRWGSRDVPVSRVGVRAVQRAVRADSIALEPRPAGCYADLCD